MMAERPAGLLTQKLQYPYNNCTKSKISKVLHWPTALQLCTRFAMLTIVFIFLSPNVKKKVVRTV